MNQSRCDMTATPVGTFGHEPPVIPTQAGAATSAPRAAAGSAGGGAELVIRRGPHAGTAIPVAGTVTVGRGRDCDITLDAPTVSLCHARIHRVGARYAIVDSGSLNGTYLNRNPVDRAELEDGDELWIGTYRFTFRTT
ncbi:FHA domain-containing protein [Saccharopolyspora sp. NPDC050389]|uniref:FHA domain-containing protein n=1 Tax=Saccharopolyspora sp. NPDC050389 TaxID=3155516 RepID=UPI0033DB89DD